MGQRKLHLGSGGLKLAGFESFDARDDVGADHVGDVRDLPFDNDTFDIVYFCHGLEHIPNAQVQSALMEWRRVLKNNGWLYLSVPDFSMLARLYANEGWTLGMMEPATMGGQDYEYNFHYSLWDRKKLEDALIRAKFRSVSIYGPSYFLPNGFVDWSNRRMRGWQISLNMRGQKYQ